MEENKKDIFNGEILMNKKKFRLSKHGTWLLENDRKLFNWANDNDEIVEYLNNLYEENNKIKNILLNKKKDLEDDYNRAAKAGMPTGGTIGELDTIEEILEEMGLKNE